MSASCLRTTLNIVKTLKISDAVLNNVPLQQTVPRSAIVLQVRHGSFFNRKDMEEQWDSIRSVSNAGKKRGRSSRGKMAMKVNLYAGQKFGQGVTGHVFPGLSVPFKNRPTIGDLDVQKQTEQDSTRKEREPVPKMKALKLDPLDRGYRGNRIPGRKVPTPVSSDGDDFSEFDTYVLSSKLVSNMVASQGKTFSSQILTAVGNKKGLIGLSLGRGSTAQAAIKAGANRAMKRLIYINTYDDRTIWHSFTETVHKTTVTAYPMYSGFGRKCHPCLKIICELLNIKDIAVITDGNGKNYLNVARAFLNGLEKQKSHQELADELGQNIIEYSLERDYYPRVVASPSEGHTPETAFEKPPGFNYENWCMGGKVPYRKKKKQPFYAKFPSYKKKMSIEYKRRNQSLSTLQRQVLGLQPMSKRLK